MFCPCIFLGQSTTRQNWAAIFQGEGGGLNLVVTVETWFLPKWWFRKGRCAGFHFFPVFPGFYKTKENLALQTKPPGTQVKSADLTQSALERAQQVFAELGTKGSLHWRNMASGPNGPATSYPKIVSLRCFIDREESDASEPLFWGKDSFVRHVHNSRQTLSTPTTLEQMKRNFSKDPPPRSPEHPGNFSRMSMKHWVFSWNIIFLVILRDIGTSNITLWCWFNPWRP